MDGLEFTMLWPSTCGFTYAGSKRIGVHGLNRRMTSESHETARCGLTTCGLSTGAYTQS